VEEAVVACLMYYASIYLGEVKRTTTTSVAIASPRADILIKDPSNAKLQD
jgi:hypothetical protein